MGWKQFLGFIFIFIVFTLLAMYWFFPLNEISFTARSSGNSNFTINSLVNNSMQFYPNMRYPDSRISYKISDCTLQKQDDMEKAFRTLENKTVLEFYLVSSNEEISITCDSKTKIEGGLFIAGEGGPTNITQAGEFNVIEGGSILLLRDSKCETPLVPIHELFHALGFDHSENENNVMYPVSKCGQQIGQDSIDLINSLYTVDKDPDLQFESAEASMKSRYLDVSMTIRNNGLEDSETATVFVYGDNKELKSIDVEPLEIGAGRIITLSNIFVLQKDITKVELKISYPHAELDKNNNVLSLEIKNN